MGLLDAPQRGDDAGIRTLLARIGELEAQLRMVAAAAAGSQGQLDFLLGQTVSAEAAPVSFTSVTVDPATSNVPETWVPFDADADAQVTLTTSSTGRIAVLAGGSIGLYSAGYCYSYGLVGVEILDELGTVVRGPLSGDGNRTMLWSGNGYVLNSGSGHQHEWALTPDTPYTMRCRRGYSIGAGPSGAVAGIDFQGTALSVTKLGM